MVIQPLRDMLSSFQTTLTELCARSLTEHGTCWETQVPPASRLHEFAGKVSNDISSFLEDVFGLSSSAVQYTVEASRITNIMVPYS